MANVIGRDFNIEYSLVDGRVREFEVNKEILYDEDNGIATEGWEQKLYDFVERAGWNRPTLHGRMRFVNRLIEEGKVKEGFNHLFVKSEEG